MNKSLSLNRKSAKNRSSTPSKQMLTHHQRLYQALNLGITKCHYNEGRKWQSMDIEIQRLAIRSISAFIACISSDTLQHSLVKDSIADIVLALIGITKTRNEALLGMTAEVTVTFVDVLGNYITLHQLLKLVGSFSNLLSFPQSSIVISCATALNRVLLKLGAKSLRSQNEVWEILKESKAVECIVYCLQGFIDGSKPFECFQEMASLLETVLLHWPPSRYPVWSNVKLMEGLGGICTKTDSSVEVAVLQVYSALGSHHFLMLCVVTGPRSSLTTPMILHCMESSQPQFVRVKAFKLALCLARSEQGWLTIAKTCCESVVKAIIDALGGWNSCSGKVATNQVPLLALACKLASITRWSGEHHTYFWKLGVDRVLLNLLVDNFYKRKQPESGASLKELADAARKGLDANYLLVLRPYIWDILGWLATHCSENFNPEAQGNSHSLNILITCGCLILMDAVQQKRQVSLEASNVEPASKAVLLMIHSPCKYIASQATYILSELSSYNVEVYLEYVLGTIDSRKFGANFSVVNKVQTVNDLIVLSCVSVLPKYRSFIIEYDGIMVLSTFTAWCLSSNASDSPSPHSTSNHNTCCTLDTEDWDSGDTLLFFSMWGLGELIRDCRTVANHGEVTSSQLAGGVNLGSFDVRTFIDKLQTVSSSNSNSSGLRWWAAHILRFFGLYGFPSRFGRRIGKALYEKELADVHFKLFSGESLTGHGVILKVRCPSLFPSVESPSISNGKICDGSSVGQDIEKPCRNFQREVRLSARVDQKFLMKLLEFVYMGFVQVDDDIVKPLKMLARGCDFNSLSQLLSRNRPKWGTKVSCCDFTPALGPSGLHFCDMVVEAKNDEAVDWTCRYCSLSSPHMHVHKIMLWLSSDYFKALFQSGMQESRSHNIKVPVGWKALSKLIHWFYSDELPKPSLGCIWNNMDVVGQLQEVHPYLELCWLAEIWLLEDFRDDALRVVVSCLSSNRNLALKIIQIATELSQWEIVEVAADCIAPSFPHLRNSGDLEFLNEELVDIIRRAHVRLSQAGYSD